MAHSCWNVPSTVGCHQRMRVLLVRALGGMCSAMYLGVTVCSLKLNCSIVFQEMPPLVEYCSSTGSVTKSRVCVLPQPSWMKNWMILKCRVRSFVHSPNRRTNRQTETESDTKDCLYIHCTDSLVILSKLAIYLQEHFSQYEIDSRNEKRVTH